MKKIQFRMAAVFLVVAVAVSMLMPATVLAMGTGTTTIDAGTSLDTLKAAITSAQDGDTIQLTTDIISTNTTSGMLIIRGKAITLDLNGHILKLDGTAPVTTTDPAFTDPIFVADADATQTDSSLLSMPPKSKLTVMDSVGGGKITSNANPDVIGVKKGTLDVESGTIEATSTYTVPKTGSTASAIIITPIKAVDPDLGDVSTVTIGGTAKIIAQGWGICVPGVTGYTHAYGTAININGGTIDAQSAVYIDGTYKDTTGNVPQVSITGGVINGTVYIAGYTNVDISGGMINAQVGSGIEMKSGTLTMTDGAINGAGSASHVAKSNGPSTSGYGVVVVNNSGYAGNIDVNISGGTITSAADGVAFGIVNDNGTTAPATPPVVSISGGSFDGPIAVDDSVGVLGFISGGAFASNAGISTDWIADGFALTQNTDGSYDVVVFVPVTGITGVPTAATVGTALTLTGTVAPADATNQDIVWSMQSAGTTGATVSGSTFKATAAGTAVVTATITDGTAVGEDYTKNFTITVSAASLSAAVQNAINAINGLPTSVASAADAAQVAAAAAAYNALSPADQAQIPQAAKDKLAAAQASAKAFNTPAQVVAIRAAQTTFNVVKGKSLTITYEADVAAGETKTPVFTWTSDAPQNVSVDNTGKVTGVVAGKSAKITVASDSGMTKIFTVKVAAKAVKATKISVSKPPKTMTVGQVKTLKVKLSPAKATGAVPSFKSSKSSVITVDKAGQLKAVAKGTAKITVKEGGKKIVITIKVK